MLAKPVGRLKLGEAIAIVRSARGWTQEQLANASGVSRMTISRLELGERIPRRATLYRLAKALKIPSELLSDSRVSESELLAALRAPTGSRNPKSPASRAAQKTLLPLRSLPVLRREDLEGIRLTDGARQESERWLPARSEDLSAFFLLAEGSELTWDERCPEGAELLLEPSIEAQSGDLVVVRSPAGLALRRLIVSEGHRELRSLTPEQTTLVWSPGLEFARVGRVSVDPSLWS